MNQDDRLSPLGAEMAAGLAEFCDALESATPIEKKFTVRTVKLDLQPRSYGPDDVKNVRAKFNASQALMAEFLGVSVKTLRAWEQGRAEVPRIACRYLDDILANPDIFHKRIITTRKLPV